MRRTAYQDRIRDLLDLEHPPLDLQPIEPTAGPLEPEKKREPYDDLWLWKRQNDRTGGLGE